jgi:hypothetical protein
MPDLHATEEELILHYYGEGADSRIELHLAECARCRQSLDELRHVLSLVVAHPSPEPLAGLEQRVWARIRPEIAHAHTSWVTRAFAATPRWVFAGGAVAAMVLAFAAGRFTTPRVETPTPPQVAATVEADNTGRLMTVAVGDHLDESQLVLLELLNGDTGTLASIQDEQMRARDLVAANRLYRQTAVRAGDEGVREVLDALERVLIEIANAPPDVSARELEALRADIEQRGILFRVRVVAAEMRAREQRDVTGTRVGP